MIFEIIIWIITIFVVSFFIGALFGSPWLPTRKEDFKRIEKLIELKPNMIFYDLGSGSGELLFYLAQKYKIKCVGIEISPLLYAYSKFKSLFYKNVDIKYGNFLRYDLSLADVIYAFLTPNLYSKLEKKIKNDVKKESTLILLSTWPFQNKKPHKISKEDKKITYYLYKRADF
jgi:SAM-dependent methyltransferase